MLQYDLHPIFKFIRMNNEISRERKCPLESLNDKVSLIISQIIANESMSKSIYSKTESKKSSIDTELDITSPYSVFEVDQFSYNKALIIDD